MNWYKLIIAGNRDDYLRQLGADESIISYINSLDQNSAQFLTNEFRKNPSMSLAQIQQLQLPQKRDPNDEKEKGIASSYTAPMQKWVLVQLRRARQGFSDISYEKAKEELVIMKFALEDWFRSEQPDLYRMTLSEALEANKIWHDQMAKKGEGGEYDPTDQSLILHGPDWKDEEGNPIPKWQGWTIQKVVTENDLEVEGNKMSHCVGSYYGDVERGHVAIYSLRDPKNDPHVTISATPDYDNREKYVDVEQIQGYGNSEPKDEYKKMIKNWVQHGKCDLEALADRDDAIDDAVRYNTMRGHYNLNGLVDDLQGALVDSDEYGLKSVTSIDEDDLEKVFEGGLDVMNEYSRYGEYFGDRGLSKVLVDMAFMADVHKRPYGGLFTLMELIDHKREDVEHYTYDWDVGVPYPQEEDYEDEEEYEKALEEHDQARWREMEERLPWGWLTELWNEMQKQWQERENRPWSELWQYENVKS